MKFARRVPQLEAPSVWRHCYGTSGSPVLRMRLAWPLPILAPVAGCLQLPLGYPQLLFGGAFERRIRWKIETQSSKYS